MTDVPDLPNFSHFHDGFRGDAGDKTNEGDIRSGFFAAYNAAGCEYIRLNDPELDRRLKNGPDLVSANFVIPYPPGFPIMVPGQVITQGTIDFMRKLDVKEIHGYEQRAGPQARASGGVGKARWTVIRGYTGSKPPRSNGAGNGEDDIMIDWFVQTLRSYPEIAIFLSLALGYYFGSFTYKGLGLGAVTATLIAAVIIGQLEIKIGSPLKPVFFLMFLFAIGYGVGPQFVRGIAQDGIPQALFAVVVCLFCLGAAYGGAKLAGYSVGSAAGLYAGSQTISASMGLATDAINRLGLSPEEAKKTLDAMPVAYAVTYIFGTIGSRDCSGVAWSGAPWHRP